jgi:hypothetical protein
LIVEVDVKQLARFDGLRHNMIEIQDPTSVRGPTLDLRQPFPGDPA